MSKDKNILVKRAILIAYRAMLVERYDYKKLNDTYNFPVYFTENKLLKFRDYFLEYMYPHPDKREELEGAFEILNVYLQNPRKLIKLIYDSSTLVFKFGTKLPAIANAGIKALRSFKMATSFEKKLFHNALLFEMTAPFEIADIEYLISTIKRKEIDKFITACEQLFEVIQNRDLVEKIINVHEILIAKMEKQPQKYTVTEVDSLKIGYTIIKLGNDLFSDLSKEESQNIFRIIVQIEKDNLDRIFEG